MLESIQRSEFISLKPFKEVEASLLTYHSIQMPILKFDWRRVSTDMPV
jgi:hypothetical protein